MQKIRINDLARELEVKSKAILDVLPLVGVTEKKTHSSSIEENEAERVRQHFQAAAESQSAGSRSSRAARPDDGIRTKIDLSHISKPGDVLKAIHQQSAPTPPAPTRPPVAVPPHPPVATRPAAPTAVPPARPVVAPPPPPEAPAAAPPAATAPPPAPVAPPRVTAAPPAATTAPPAPPR